jgi:hypothetical protein
MRNCLRKRRERAKVNGGPLTNERARTTDLGVFARHHGLVMSIQLSSNTVALLLASVFDELPGRDSITK